MARDKLITIRIEGEKREAFNNLAKSQNTDTASVLYDFISGCLDGRIDISLVTGKGNRLDKIDNRIDSDRIDKLEATTQRIDHWIGALSERLNDWILRSDRRVNDCEKELSNKITSLEHRLNALSMQLDSQKDSQQIDSIDTDSQKDRQGENPDIEPVATVETAIDTVETVKENVEAVTEIDESDDEPDTSPLPPSPSPSLPPDETVQPAIGTVTPEVSPSPPGTDAIASIDGTVESVEPNSSIETVASAIELTNKEKAAILGIDDSNLSKWVRNGEIPKKYDNKCRFNENKTKIILI